MSTSTLQGRRLPRMHACVFGRWSSRRRATTRWAAFWSAVVLTAIGQPPTTEPPRDPPAPVQLSPFEVTADQLAGYAAQATLSGSRTRTALKDVASAVGVYTRDFLDDLGAVSETDVLQYSASVVPEIGDQTARGRSDAMVKPESYKLQAKLSF